MNKRILSISGVLLLWVFAAGPVGAHYVIGGGGGGSEDEVETLTAGDLCSTDGTDIYCTVNTEAELETALDAINVILATEIDTSAELIAILGDETGTGVVVFGTSPTLTGTITINGTAIIEAGVALGFGDSTDAAITHTIGLVGTDVVISYTDGAVDYSVPITASSFIADPVASPMMMLYDVDAPGAELADKEIGGVLGQYVDGAEDSENSDVCMFLKQAGSDVSVLCYDESEERLNSAGTVTAAVGFDCTGDADCDYGNADTDDHTFTTDGTGDGEMVFPENSIGPDEVAVPMQPIFFCGELGVAAQEFFAGPNMVSVFTGAVPTDHTFASGNCDTLGNTTVGTVDASLDDFQSYKVNGMFCQVSATPGVAATVMTFVDDEVNTPVTCTIASDEMSCTSVIATTTDVAASSQVAVSSLNGTDDESLQDMHCLVYISWK